MADINVDGAGNAGTTKATTAGTLTFGGSIDTSYLKRKIESQKKQLDLQEQRIQLLERDLRLARASNSGNNMGFTKEELNFILSKVHPDKNPNSKIATSLTTKLIKERKK